MSGRKAAGNRGVGAGRHRDEMEIWERDEPLKSV